MTTLFAHGGGNFPLPDLLIFSVFAFPVIGVISLLGCFIGLFLKSIKAKMILGWFGVFGGLLALIATSLVFMLEFNPSKADGILILGGSYTVIQLGVAIFLLFRTFQTKRLQRQA